MWAEQPSAVTGFLAATADRCMTEGDCHRKQPTTGIHAPRVAFRACITCWGACVCLCQLVWLVTHLHDVPGSWHAFAIVD